MDRDQIIANRRFLLLTLILHVFANIGAAQHISAGVKAGVPLAEAFEKDTVVPRFNYTFNTKRYTIGPTADVSLPLRLGFEADVLYTRLDYASTIMGVDTFTRSATKANAWQFPLLLKKGLNVAGLRPNVDIGFALRHVGGTSHIVKTVFPSHVFEVTTPPSELIHNWTTGFALGGGFEFSTGSLRLSPELRYTRWFRENFGTPAGIFQSNLNEVEFLLGLHRRIF